MGSFYRRLINGPLKSKDSTAQPATGDAVLSLVATRAPKKPRRSGYLGQYMKMNYKTAMKKEGDRRLNAAFIAYNMLTDEEREKIKPPAAIQIRKTVAEEFWATESDAVREDVKAKAKEIHEEELKEWAQLKEVPQTPAQHYQ